MPWITDNSTARTFTSHFSHQADTVCQMIHSVHYSWQIHLYLSEKVFSQLNNKKAPRFLSVSTVMVDFIERMSFGIQQWSINWFCLAAGFFCRSTHRWIQLKWPWTETQCVCVCVWYYFNTYFSLFFLLFLFIFCPSVSHVLYLLTIHSPWSCYLSISLHAVLWTIVYIMNKSFNQTCNF